VSETRTSNRQGLLWQPGSRAPSGKRARFQQSSSQADDPTASATGDNAVEDPSTPQAGISNSNGAGNLCPTAILGWWQSQMCIRCGRCPGPSSNMSSALAGVWHPGSRRVTQQQGWAPSRSSTSHHTAGIGGAGLTQLPTVVCIAPCWQPSSFWMTTCLCTSAGCRHFLYSCCQWPGPPAEMAHFPTGDVCQSHEALHSARCYASELIQEKSIMLPCRQAACSRRP